jgi:uncharacterized protein YbbK (DUF523 family)
LGVVREDDLQALAAVLNGSDEEAALRAAREVGRQGRPVVVSACLMGAPVRFDGQAKTSTRVPKAVDGRPVLPLCPELLAGLGCPRPPIHFVRGSGPDVVAGTASAPDSDGIDRGPELVAGARRALALAQAAGAPEAILKERSPSCGCRQIHGAGGVRPGEGVFATLARQAGLECVSDEEL